MVCVYIIGGGVFMERTFVKFVNGYGVDGDKGVDLFHTEDGDFVFEFSRGFVPSDTRGLSLTDIKKKMVRATATTKRKGNKIVTKIRFSKEMVYAIKRLLNENFVFKNQHTPAQK